LREKLDKRLEQADALRRERNSSRPGERTEELGEEADWGGARWAERVEGVQPQANVADSRGVLSSEGRMAEDAGEQVTQLAKKLNVKMFVRKELRKLPEMLDEGEEVVNLAEPPSVELARRHVVTACWCG